ncbi:MAG: hypothetical protein OWU33_07885 [Firmicutes bacterium]|nr:hypothetical protein [Bacillota bacterium]
MRFTEHAVINRRRRYRTNTLTATTEVTLVALGFALLGHPPYGAGLVALVGLAAVTPPRPQRTRRSEWSLPLVICVAIILKSIAWSRFRIHLMGRLPRGPVIIVANHAHDADSMILPVTLAMRRGLHHPLISSGSSRLFEPGFLAERMPPALGQWLAGLNLSSILWSIGVRPIEDAPLSHSLKSWAYLIYQVWGDEPLGDVFDEQLIPEEARGRAISYLWSRGGWALSHQRHTLRALKDPYRHWVRDHTRDLLESQMAVLREAADRGFAIYTTPEGRLTTDGRMARFRASWTLLVNGYRGSVVAAATSYDVLRRGRLHLWTMLAPLTRLESAESAVARLRPVTASHLVAHAWFATSQRTLDRLVAIALDTYHQLPHHAVIAHNLAQNPQGLIRRRVRWLLRALSQGAPLRDKRFPHVPDILTYYANQLTEILSALDSDVAPSALAQRNPLTVEGDAQSSLDRA